MATHQIGLVGLDVMGQNLVLNIEGRGYSVAGYNRTTEKMTRFVHERCRGKRIAGYEKIEGFCAALQRPRKIILMVKAGPPVDAVIGQLRPHLQAGDLLIDAGNSFFQDTERRLADLAKDGLLYIGTGVSGGEEGALKGPSIMPGGSEAAYALVRDVLEKIAAQVDGPCCAYIGPRGAGHYVKMVHNGIEYGIMECIAEVYDLLKSALGLKPPAMAKIFADWTAGELGGYLMDITADILTRRHPRQGRPEGHRQVDQPERPGPGRRLPDD
jgi:6-phosphogluconate dehydrogenase